MIIVINGQLFQTGEFAFDLGGELYPSERKIGKHNIIIGPLYP